MKTIKLFFAMSLICNASFAQTLEGRFEGAVTRDGSIQLINFNFHNEEGSHKGTYEIPEAGFYDVPIDEIKLTNDTLSITFYFGKFNCFLNETADEITGISEKWSPKLRVHVKKVNHKEKPFEQKNISFRNGNIRLSGMLYEPNTCKEKTKKYIILVHGSGAQTRYSPYYISLGYTLARNGYGVLLYDKRGTGKSEGSYKTASFDNLANDAVAAYKYLKNLKGDTEIGFLGTSQGGWIAPMAANKTKDCDFLILNVSPAVSVFEQDLHRVEYTMKADGWNQSDIDAALSYSKLFFQYALDNNQNSWLKLKASSVEVMSSKWVDYINIPENKNDFEWWRNNNYDPAKTLKALKCRTLCIYGEYDPLVPPGENIELMTNYLSKSNAQFDIIEIPGVLHDMKTFQSLNGDNWKWPLVYWQWRREPKEFMTSILAFLSKKG